MRVRRRVALAAVFVLIVSACSGGDDSPVFGDSTTTTVADGSVTTSTADVSSTIVEFVDPDPLLLGDDGVAAAHAITEALGDSTAPAMLLAIERGHDVDQLLAIGGGGIRIDETGRLFDGDTEVDPVNERLGLIGIPVEEDGGVQFLRSRQESRGSYDPTASFDLADVARNVEESVDFGEHPVDASLDAEAVVAAMILLLPRNGYSMEQIIEALVLGARLERRTFDVDEDDLEDLGLTGDEDVEVSCGVLVLVGEPIVPAGDGVKPHCRVLLEGAFGFPGVRGLTARSTRPSERLLLSAVFVDYGDIDREIAWAEASEFTWTVDGEVVSTEARHTLSHEHSFEEPGSHTAGLTVIGPEGQTLEFEAEFEVLPVFDTGLGPISVVSAEGDEYPVAFALYDGELARFVPIVQGSTRGYLSGGIRVGELGRWRYHELEEIDPPDLGIPGLRAWYVDQVVVAPSVAVAVIASDFGTSSHSTYEEELPVAEAPANPTAWGGGDSCSGEGEGAEYSTQWQVRMTDNGDGTWTADIYYHDCPDRGRAHYRGPAIPITPYRWMAEVEFVDGRGPLGGNAPAQMPGPLTHYLVSQFGFEDNVQETIGVR